MKPRPPILSVFALLPWLLPVARGEDHVDYRYEFYDEDNGRIEVETYSAAFEKKLTDAVTVRGEAVYDGISGATPDGAAPLPGKSAVPLTEMHEIRRAGKLAFDMRLGRHTVTPQVAYSKESDYVSTGVSLADAIEFNNKNTVLRLGVSHDFDDVLDAASPRRARHKDATDGIIGLTQLLSPNTILSADFTFGVADGYLNDPYKAMSYAGWIGILGHPLAFPGAERRPDHRARQVLQLNLTHYFERLKGSGEITYRFGHDTFGVFSQTASANWHQKIGSHVIVEPLFRFYEQSAADFYRLSVPGYAPTDGQDATRPAFYSADYRLSRLFSLTYGVQVSVVIREQFVVDFGYHRYEMHGLDHQTAASAYAAADIFTLGARIWF